VGDFVYAAVLEVQFGHGKVMRKGVPVNRGNGCKQRDKNNGGDDQGNEGNMNPEYFSARDGYHADSE